MGYDTDAILGDLEARGIEPVTPPKRARGIRRRINGQLYTLRDLVERCFSKLKDSRTLATRHGGAATTITASQTPSPLEYELGLHQQILV